jgi:hypothetical protein
MNLSTYMTSCGCSSELMTGQAWLKGGTFAHGAAGPFVWLGASDRSWADYSPIY